MRPKVPVNLSFNLAPIDSQLSSSKVISFSLQRAVILAKSFGFPKRFTARITFVDGVIAASSSFKSKFSVSLSMSTNLTFRPYC